MTLQGIGFANTPALEFKSFSFNPTHVVCLCGDCINIFIFSGAKLLQRFVSR
jgi:hypothetical protein